MASRANVISIPFVCLHKQKEYPVKGILKLPSGYLVQMWLVENLISDLTRNVRYNRHSSKDSLYQFQDKVLVMSIIRPTRDLMRELAPPTQVILPNDAKKLHQFKDLLERMLMLDPAKRASVNHCLAHPFIQDNA